MKKLALIMSSVVMLSACSAGVDNSSPIEHLTDLKHICIKEQKTPLNFSSQEIVQFIHNSLMKKQITSEVYKPNGNCKYILAYSLKGQENIINKAKIAVSEVNNSGRSRIGEVGYKYRGKEVEETKQTGIQGQFDKMITELFKNN